MKRIILLGLILFTSIEGRTQFIEERAIDVSAGLGISSGYDDYDLSGTGFYGQVELVLSPASWIDLRPYAGMIMTETSGEYKEKIALGYRSTAEAFMFGGKTRLIAPIPWIAPYGEIGIGGSVGSFQTITPYTNIEDNGFFLHIPFTVGLELGRRHGVNIEFTYYFHNKVQQYSGAAAFGVSIPLED